MESRKEPWARRDTHAHDRKSDRPKAPAWTARRTDDAVPPGSCVGGLYPVRQRTSSRDAKRCCQPRPHECRQPGSRRNPPANLDVWPENNIHDPVQRTGPDSFLGRLRTFIYTRTYSVALRTVAQHVALRILKVLGNNQEKGEGVNARPQTLSDAHHKVCRQEMDVTHGNTEEYRAYEGEKGAVVDRRVIFCAVLTEGSWCRTPGSITLDVVCYWASRNCGIHSTHMMKRMPRTLFRRGVGGDGRTFLAGHRPARVCLSLLPKGIVTGQKTRAGAYVLRQVAIVNVRRRRLTKRRAPGLTRA